MGLAASQARWVSLAARKSNVEYEGQQINQARTALANQSSELWNKLYTMEVPTAPSTADFTTTQYTFNDGDVEQTIETMQDADYTDSDGIHYNKYITYYSKIQEYKGIRNTNSNPQVQYIENPSGLDGYYMVGTNKLTCLDSIDRNETSSGSEWETYCLELDQIAKDWPDTQLAKDWINYRENGNDSVLKNICVWKDLSNENNFVSVSAETGDSLTECINDPLLSLHSYYADYQKVNKELKKYALVEYDASGRATSMRLEGSSVIYNLETATKTDDNAYNDAVNKYNYEQQKYEKMVQDINAKTEQIQTEDRTLELRLKALDTEQNALQTEMDAVHKIISKNIESTFKTFES